MIRLDKRATCLAVQHRSQSHQSKLRKNTEPERNLPWATVSSPLCLCLRDTDPCLRSKVLQLSGTWDSRLMSLLCKLLLLFEAERPWCLMYFQWTFSWISGIFLMRWNVLQNKNYENMDVSLLRCKRLISKDKLYHNSFKTFLCVKTHALCEHIYAVVDILGPFIHMGAAPCNSSTELLFGAIPLGQWFLTCDFWPPHGVVRWIEGVTRWLIWEKCSVVFISLIFF